VQFLHRFRRRRRPAAAPTGYYRAPGGSPGTAAPSGLTPVCSACGKALESRTPPRESLLRPTYVAVICRVCNWIECRACKGSPSDAPCTICGSPVVPALRDYFEST
jgi:hypothetical protein